jgi:glyoxylase-like metal-dependent hydrolase (beta-lactamase superfamily II)
VTDGPAIAPAGGWRIDLLELGTAIHPGRWVGPTFPEWMWSPINALLLRGHGTAVLVDAGSGVLAPLWPFDGITSDLASALARAGAAPQEIELVVLSHLDDDHVGGLLAGSWPDTLALALPGTRVAAPAAAVAAARAAEPSSPQRIVVETLDRGGVLTTYVDGDEVAPGVRVHDAPGHRIGHAVVSVGSTDGPHGAFLHLCDALHHLAHVAEPEWDREADSEPVTALATRKELLRRCAAAGTRLVATHIPGPGAFRVELSAGSRLDAVPAVA